jgi:bifunctional UDP-N-acetylglucosamine pyrophosphorylase/glucosamine-1-phosphate N-acetyltransferase
MKGFILAAGEGTRMRPLTTNIPKPLLPVAGKPMIVHTLEAMKQCGINQIYVLVGWRAQRLKNYLGDGGKFGVRIEYVTQDQRLGTAHAVSMLRDRLTERFCCIYGDVVVTPSALREALSKSMDRRESVMCVAPVEDPSRYGAVSVSGDEVTGIWEKSQTAHGNLINAGIYVLNPNIFDYIEQTELSPRGEYELTDSLSLLMKKEPLKAQLIEKGWLDVARPWDLLTANEIIMKELVPEVKGSVEPGAVLKGPVHVGEGTEVLAGSYIVGPVYIGEECEIGPNCFIRPSTSIGDRCKVGNAVEVKNSIIMNDSKVPHNSYVGDSIIGERCNFGAGTKVANLRFDDKPVPVIIDGQKVSSGRRKLGVIMGDDVKTGINASIEPGTIIEEGAIIGPGANASGYIAARSRIY